MKSTPDLQSAFFSIVLYTVMMWLCWGYLFSPNHSETIVICILVTSILSYGFFMGLYKFYIDAYIVEIRNKEKEIVIKSIIKNKKIFKFEELKNVEFTHSKKNPCEQTGLKLTFREEETFTLNAESSHNFKAIYHELKLILNRTNGEQLTG